MSNWSLEDFYKNGFAVIDNFLPQEDLEKTFQAGSDLCKNIPKNERCIFNASMLKGPQLKDQYFVESSNRISHFFEKDALDNDGNLLVDESISLNKVGHALHRLHPTFKSITFSDRVRNVCQKFDMKKPVVVQSMYIYKNPGIGGEVKAHQDATYLYTVPNNIIGFWIPVEDATIENGCLWFAPGSHTKGLHRRLIRNPDKTTNDILVYQGSDKSLDNEEFIPCPVKKGSLVLIHGLVGHKSEFNKSKKSRHAYTFHVMDADNAKWSEENWLQLPDGQSFENLN